MLYASFNSLVLSHMHTKHNNIILIPASAEQICGCFEVLIFIQFIIIVCFFFCVTFIPPIALFCCLLLVLLLHCCTVHLLNRLFMQKIIQHKTSDYPVVAFYCTTRAQSYKNAHWQPSEYIAQHSKAQPSQHIGKYGMPNLRQAKLPTIAGSNSARNALTTASRGGVGQGCSRQLPKERSVAT